ncbi:MAG: glucans biosynthesis glucosyltransferase MdoH [Verrucomicrobia bacterium]|nr:MAG: glucans biosynthesis glucosyltransferase MdoH [Verrucomicrobiota bacterium]
MIADDSQPIDGPVFYPAKKVRRRRILFFGAVLIVNLISSLWLLDLMWRMGFQKAHFPFMLVFLLLNGLLVLGSFHAWFGALEMLRGKKRSVRISALAEKASGPLKMRHAVVMPVYNEDSVKTCARIEAIYRSIEATGHLESFDFFILSDTRDLDLWVLEETSWTNLCRRLGGFGRIYYRRRKTNENRKAGNIGDFVRTWGGRYESMLVLDADSLMDGADIVKMTQVMENYPRLGILQTPPKLIRGASVFTRLQQFAMRLYGPLFIQGLNFWQLSGGSYWGHNALIRLQPFSEYCELPALPGREPFGGRILSHDFVEAALMVGKGWEVWLAWDIEGTYEEAPPTLVDHLIRDRRWCQGNLQHLWLIFARKLPFSVRMHLFMGIMAYLGSPLWFLFLLLGTWIAWDRSQSNLSQLPFDSYAERWFGVNGVQQSVILTLGVFILLFSPKILAVIGAILNKKTRHSFGGALRIIFGAGFETIISMLLAPVIMAAHTVMVFSIAMGKAVGWGNQNRETDGTSWGDAIRFHLTPTLLGLVWSFVAWKIGVTFFAWMLPILIGLIFAAPVSVFTSRVRYGQALARRKLLAIPEELNKPQIMELADQATAALDPALDASVGERYGLIAAVVDPYVNGVHVSFLEQAELTDQDRALAEKCLVEGPSALAKNELSDLLYLGSAMLMMHRAVWLRPADAIHSVWTQALQSYRRRLDHISSV